MFIKNDTPKPIILSMKVEGYDDQEDVVQPGKTSSMWLHLEDEDIITVKEYEEVS